MSVYIKGMEMPPSCRYCEFRHMSITQNAFCTAAHETIDYMAERTKRLDNCPLIPVPPHGRLIDEENICGKLRPLIENPYCYNRLQIISETLAHCLRIISDTPTIIPAEEGE